MNRFDIYIPDYLIENKEVALEKIGVFKTVAGGAQNLQTAAVEFIFDRKAVTSAGLINFISEKTGKNKFLITSDLESHFAQVREFINIGKSYEIPDVGFVKANKAGAYEFLPYSEANKPAKISSPATTQAKRNNNRSFLQLITFLIVLAILSGLGWQAYQFFGKKQPASNVNAVNNQDTIATSNLHDTNKIVDTASQQTNAYDSTDTVNVRYIFETTASGLRARTRTAQLKSFGNDAGYDSFVRNDTKFFDLYLIQPTRLTDTLTIKDSLAKFFEKDIKLVIEPKP